MRAPAILIFLPCLVLPCGACATTEAEDFVKPGATEAQMKQDRLQCESIMYQERNARGKGSPSWNRFAYCMKERGYVRKSAAKTGARSVPEGTVSG